MFFFLDTVDPINDDSMQSARDIGTTKGPSSECKNERVAVMIAMLTVFFFYSLAPLTHVDQKIPSSALNGQPSGDCKSICVLLYKIIDSHLTTQTTICCWPTKILVNQNLFSNPVSL
jgi:hypothetical protein